MNPRTPYVRQARATRRHLGRCYFCSRRAVRYTACEKCRRYQAAWKRKKRARSAQNEQHRQAEAIRTLLMNTVNEFRKTVSGLDGRVKGNGSDGSTSAGDIGPMARCEHCGVLSAAEAMACEEGDCKITDWRVRETTCCYW